MKTCFFRSLLFTVTFILYSSISYFGYSQNIINDLNGAKFKAFVDRVNSAVSDNKEAIIDSFMNYEISFPYIENDSIAYYIYQGDAKFVNIAGDANNWDPKTDSMIKLSGTNFWYYEAKYEPDARLDYKFVLDTISYILDPLNPNTIAGGFGLNSELAMPQYIQPPEIKYYPEISHGNIDSISFKSHLLNNTRTIKVYLPCNYKSRLSDSSPVVLFHDGIDFLNLGSAANILDYLIANQKIEPLIGVFIPPVDRNNEYAFTKRELFESFIINEVMPYIDSVYRTSKNPHERGIIGASYGALISTQICYKHPDDFGLCGAYSPAYLPNNWEVYNSVINGEVKDIKWFIDWGSYEPKMESHGREFRNELLKKGYDLIWNEWHEGHSWGSWRAHLDNALEYFFPVYTQKK